MQLEHVFGELAVLVGRAMAKRWLQLQASPMPEQRGNTPRTQRETDNRVIEHELSRKATASESEASES